MNSAKMVFAPSGHIDLNASVDVQRRQIEFLGHEAGEFFPEEDDPSEDKASG